MAAPSPNILWIISTQWRARALGYAGDRNACTPCLDARAAQGTVYSAAVSPHPFGPFARAAMLTGVASPQNGVSAYFDPLPISSRTIAHELGERGYATAWFGKWHLAPRDRNAPLVGEVHARTVVAPDSRGGFQFWEGFEGGFLLNDPWLHGTRLPEPVRVAGYQSDILCGRAAAWMGGQPSGAEPWFCVTSLESPHPPYNAPAPADRPKPESLTLEPNVPLGGEVEEQARRELAGYYAHIAATDRAIGGLIDAAERLARCSSRETIVLVSSTHGDMHGAHGHFRKGWPHEESIGVPMLVWRTSQTHREQKRQPVSLLDLHAMALAWADGKVWSPRREAVEISMPSVVPFPRQCDRVWRGLRAQTWKAVFQDDGTPWLIYDLERDPWELDNLAGTPRGAVILERARATESGKA